MVGSFFFLFPLLLLFFLAMTYDSEIIPTRCNNCVYSSQWLYSNVSGDNSTHHQEYNAVYGLSGRQVYLCCNFCQYSGSLIVVGRVEL